MVFTFYSFKGGVGRSMAMATVGYLLAQRGLKVLVMDFDLEAPGLERYFFDEPTQLAEVRSNPGLIDLVRDYKRALTSEAEFQRAAFKNWPAYVVEAIPQMPGGGSVELMTSGQRYPEARYNDYALAVRAFDWQDFFHNWKGDRFFEWLRRELSAPGRGYDAVLVDSRTGVTEMGGVCAYQLADVAVLLCAPNYQNVDGTRAVVTDFRSDAVVAVRRGQPLEILVVPARVEQSDPVKRDRFFDDFERVFGTEGLPKVLADAGLSYRRLAIPYRPELAIIERLVDETAPGQGGALAADSEGRAAYDLLTDALTLLADGERWQPLKSEAVERLAGHATPTRTESVADISQRGAGYDAYIEYRHVDNEPVGQLVAALGARQLSIWRGRRPTGRRRRLGVHDAARTGLLARAHRRDWEPGAGPGVLARPPEDARAAEARRAGDPSELPRSVGGARTPRAVGHRAGGPSRHRAHRRRDRPGGAGHQPCTPDRESGGGPGRGGPVSRGRAMFGRSSRRTSSDASRTSIGCSAPSTGGTSCCSKAPPASGRPRSCRRDSCLASAAPRACSR